MNQFPGGVAPTPEMLARFRALQAAQQPPPQQAFPAVNQLSMLAGQVGGGCPPGQMPGAGPAIYNPMAERLRAAAMAQARPGMAVPAQQTPMAGYGQLAGRPQMAGAGMGQFAPAGTGGAMPPSAEMLARARAMQAAGANMNAAAGGAGPPQGQQMAMALSDRRAKRVLSLREILGR